MRITGDRYLFKPYFQDTTLQNFKIQINVTFKDTVHDTVTFKATDKVNRKINFAPLFIDPIVKID